MLFHVSEDRGIDVFEPRAPDGGDALVWAIDAERLRNYLLPRECPRVTYYAGRASTEADIARFLGRNKAVIAIERGGSSACADAGCIAITCLRTPSRASTNAPGTS